MQFTNTLAASCCVSSPIPALQICLLNAVADLLHTPILGTSFQNQGLFKLHQLWAILVYFRPTLLPLKNIRIATKSCLLSHWAVSVVSAYMKTEINTFKVSQKHFFFYIFEGFLKNLSIFETDAVRRSRTF